MSSSSTKQSKVDSDVVLSLEDYRLWLTKIRVLEKNIQRLDIYTLRETLLNFDGLKVVVTED